MPYKINVSPLTRKIFNQTWPMIFGVLSIMSFQLVDSAFIGQLGVLPLATHGFTQPLQMVITGFQIGLGIATSALISRAVGANNQSYAQRLAGLILLLGGGSIFTLACILYLLREKVLLALGASADVLLLAESYWPIWLVSVWLGAMLYLMYSVSRANGDTKLPGGLMVITSLVNMVLDPVFIFQLDFGLRGAAMATACAFLGGLLVISLQVHRRHWLSFNWGDMEVIQSFRALFKVMGPALLSQLLPPLSALIVTKLLAPQGPVAVAAWTLGARYEFFSLVVVLALTMSTPPMVGKMLGAGQYADIRKLVATAARMILFLQVIIALITVAIAHMLVDLMTSQSEVAALFYQILTITPISLGALGVCMLVVSILNALGKGYLALFVSICRLFLCYLPCLFLGLTLGGMYGLLWGACIGNFLAGVCAWGIYRRSVRHFA